MAWQLEGGTLAVSWKEHGGPALSIAPAKTGFGTILSRSTIEGQMQGTLSYDWLPEGLHFKLQVPVPHLSS